MLKNNTIQVYTFDEEKEILHDIESEKQDIDCI